MAKASAPYLVGTINGIGIEIRQGEIEGWHWHLWSLVRGEPHHCFASDDGPAPIASREWALTKALRVARAYMLGAEDEDTACFVPTREAGA